jgi:predicted HAD superfamily Cof-like phosphohydrolase
MPPETLPESTGAVDFEAAVANFHRAFSVRRSDGTPQSTFELLRTRIDLITEEFSETAEAIDDLLWRTEEEQWPAEGWGHLAKELADLLYVTLGTAELLGIPMSKTFAAVHESNMSKLGADGRPILRADGKVLKGPNYRPADLSLVVDEMRANHKAFGVGE